MKTVNDLLYSIYTLINNATTEAVYKGQVPESATYPYVHFQLSNSNDNQGREDFILNINCWDKDYSSITLNNLVDTVDRAVNRHWINTTGSTASTSTGKINACFYRINRMKLPSDDEFQGTELKYVVKTYLT